ncbi:MAG TPA: class I SAM-dependent methyltransferase, partial [Candidatus Dormibacteraeota bacterium]
MTTERGETSYILPRHPSEIDRLDVQHYSLLEALGVNYLAPIEGPRRVLDVGSGTGQWCFDLAAEHPLALVVGYDLETGKAGPGNYRFVRGNVLQGLPFAAGVFDFVHQRLMATSAIPRAAWAAVVAELVRVAGPGAWVELVEVPVQVSP